MKECRSKLWFVTILGALFLSSSKTANAAGYFELGFSFSYQVSNYGDDSFTWVRRWATSFGYHFSELSEVEIGFQDAVNRSKYGTIQDVTYHDRLYSLNWVQSIFPRTIMIQPYFKVGIAQLNRDATGFYYTGESPTPTLDALSAVLGVGVKLNVSQRFSIRSELTTYLPQGSLGTYKDNLSFMVGSSVYF